MSLRWTSRLSLILNGETSFKYVDDVTSEVLLPSESDIDNFPLSDVFWLG